MKLKMEKDMNIFNKVTLKSMKKNPVRTLVTIIGIIISTAMFTAVTTLTISLYSFVYRTDRKSVV